MACIVLGAGRAYARQRIGQTPACPQVADEPSLRRAPTLGRWVKPQATAPQLQLPHANSPLTPHPFSR